MINKAKLTCLHAALPKRSVGVRGRDCVVVNGTPLVRVISGEITPPSPHSLPVPGFGNEIIIYIYIVLLKIR